MRLEQCNTKITIYDSFIIKSRFCKILLITFLKGKSTYLLLKADQAS